MFGKNKFNHGGGNFNGGQGGGNFGGGGRFRGRFGGNRSGGRGGLLGSWVSLVFVGAVLIGGGIYAQRAGWVGAIKNRYFKTPDMQKAEINQGITAVTQQNKNMAASNLYRKGNKDAASDIINQPWLLKDQFGSLSDLYSYGNVYAVYVFSNSDADNKWKDKIQTARNKGLRVMMFNGHDAPENDDTFVYRYFNNNYDLSQSNKNYGKPDGQDHPFLTLFVNGTPEKIIVDPSDEQSLFDYQLKVQQAQEKDQNNWSIPDQPIGLKSPDYGKAIQYAADRAKKLKDQAGQTYNDVKSGIGQNSNGSSSTSSSTQDSGNNLKGY